MLRPFAEQSIGQCPGGQVEPHLSAIATLCDGDDVHQVVDNIVSLQTNDPWLTKAGESLAHGSPLAALWIDRQLRETRHASLKEVFQSEIRLATNIVRHWTPFLPRHGPKTRWQTCKPRSFEESEQ